MKGVARLSTETPGLKAYRAQLQIEQRSPDWDAFRLNAPGALRELQEALIKAQHGLCAYCEINIHDAAPVQIEHYQPKSGGKGPDKIPDLTRHLDYTNLMACCMGGVSTTHDRPPTIKYEAFQDHFLPDTNLSQCCGDAKGKHEPGDEMQDPRRLCVTDKIIKIYPNGVIHPDETGCATAGVPSKRVQSTIDLLRLNCYRLTYARRKWWDALKRKLPAQQLQRVAPHRLASLLGPNEQGWLRRFWSTTRCYLPPVSAESWLAQNAGMMMPM